jgi:hypothetical protein
VNFAIRCNDLDLSTLLLTMSIFGFKFVVIIYCNYILCDCQLFAEVNVSRPLSIQFLNLSETCGEILFDPDAISIVVHRRMKSLNGPIDYYHQVDYCV